MGCETGQAGVGALGATAPAGRRERGMSGRADRRRDGKGRRGRGGGTETLVYLGAETRDKAGQEGRASSDEDVADHCLAEVYGKLGESVSVAADRKVAYLAEALHDSVRYGLDIGVRRVSDVEEHLGHPLADPPWHDQGSV